MKLSLSSIFNRRAGHSVAVIGSATGALIGGMAIFGSELIALPLAMAVATGVFFGPQIGSRVKGLLTRKQHNGHNGG